jgi:cyanate permease
MLATGAVGAALMAVPSTAAYTVGVLLALGVGWAWTGLTHFVVARVAGPATPSATGIVQTGSYLGSGGGPLLFGIAYAASGSSLDWIVVAVVIAVAACVALVLTRRTPPPTPEA